MNVCPIHGHNPRCLCPPHFLLAVCPFLGGFRHKGQEKNVRQTIGEGWPEPLRTFAAAVPSNNPCRYVKICRACQSVPSNGRCRYVMSGNLVCNVRKPDENAIILLQCRPRFASSRIHLLRQTLSCTMFLRGRAPTMHVCVWWWWWGAAAGADKNSDSAGLRCYQQVGACHR